MNFISKYELVKAARGKIPVDVLVVREGDILKIKIANIKIPIMNI